MNDIKGLVEVPDNSIYLYYGLILFGVILVFILLYFIYKFIVNKKSDVRKEYLKVLNNINLDDTKHSAYIITKYGLLIASSEKEKQLINKLIEDLENYKYKKDIEKFNDKIKISFKNFMDNLDV